MIAFSVPESLAKNYESLAFVLLSFKMAVSFDKPCKISVDAKAVTIIMAMHG